MPEQSISFTGATLSGDAAAAGYAALSALVDGNIIHNNPNFGTYRSGQNEVCVIVQWASPKKLKNFSARGWSDRGIVGDGSNFTLYLYGANSAPTAGSVGTYGTLLGSQAFTESSPGDNTLRTVVSGDQTTAYAYAVLRVVKSDGTGIALGEISGTEVVEEGGGDPPSEECLRPFLIILLHKCQSNGVGAAPVLAQTVYQNRSRIFAYGLDNQIKPAVEPLMDTTNSQWSTFNNTQVGSSPAMAFANALLDEIDNHDLLIVPSAKGATDHTQWVKGGTLYNASVSRAQMAITAATAARPGSKVLCVVTQQAESSTTSTSMANDWKADLPVAVKNFLTDMNLALDTPAVMPGLGQNPTGANATNAPAWDYLRKGQATMTLPPNVVYVPISDLPSDDGVNAGADILNTATVFEAGVRMKAALWSRLPNYVRQML